MDLGDLLEAFGEWVLSNLDNILLSAFTVVALYLVYIVLVRQITELQRRGKLRAHLALTLTRIAKWVFALVGFSAILAQWGVTLGTISGLLTVFGGTIIGFAAINTIGNAIAGLIVMTSRPFEIGDRIYFNGQFADVVSIELIYTKMRTLDNVLLSIPNQELLRVQIDNYQREAIIRRSCSVTPGFEYDSSVVEEALLEAAKQVSGVLEEPKPYVWISGFRDYAVEYQLYVFVGDAKRIPEIDAELHRMALATCKKRGIDISTPILMKQIK